ncbi:hypothetical protein [Chelativorans sp. M5D2P16]|uniref:hypothetical protein n=1 Tax=Chelativorans sp. M5D2P16 TaxID=3095678 RepID=UPI002ACABC9C|nr:hypothetical protein [Chelativorans sp. M5D2P16]MDZ5700088.1 hypothetical protein [Chelativorans sp. M5D2P16]
MPARKKDGEGKSEREKRLAAELRANLTRRKAQARSRQTGDTDRRDEGIPPAGRERRD